MSTYLIVCPRAAQLPRLRRLLRRAAGPVVVASDDPAVHAFAEAAGVQVTWLEDLEYFLEIADEVKELTDRINDWLATLADPVHGIPERLLFWTKHVEGGYTIQRVQDVLLLVRAYLRMLDAVRPDRITLIHGGVGHWEASVFVACAQSRGVPVREIGVLRPTVLIGRARDALNLWLRVPHAVAFWMGARLTNRARPKPDRPADILIQVCDSAPKHVEYAVRLMEALRKEGGDVAALCWRAPRGAVRFRKIGVRADDLERWVGPADVVAGLVQARRAWRAARSRRAEFEGMHSLTHCGIRLGPLLWPSIEFFLRTELPSRYYLMAGATRYFRSLAPRVMRFWTIIFPQAVITYHSIEERKRPLIFHAPGFPYGRPDPYGHRILPVDLELALSEEHRDMLASGESPPKAIVTVGHDRWGMAAQFKGRYAQAESRAILGLPPAPGLTILYDPGYVIRGYRSAREQVSVTRALLDLARSDPSICLVVKPHPSHRRGLLESQVGGEAPRNLFIVDSGALPHHCLNAADVLITKDSTLGIEAFYLDRPLISVILDGKRKFSIFGDGAEYVFDIDHLHDLVRRLTDRSELLRWTEERLARAREHLIRASYRTSRSPEELTAAAVMDILGAAPEPLQGAAHPAADPAPVGAVRDLDPPAGPAPTEDE